MKHRSIALMGGIGVAAALVLYGAKTDGMNIMTGPKAFTNTASLSPGLARKITAQDLPQPQSPAMLRRSEMYGVGFGRKAVRPEKAIPKAPAGFQVDIYVASGLTNPRQIRRAPNGDIFVADTAAEQFESSVASQRTASRRSLRCTPVSPAPFGINFYPPGPNPQWVYVTNTSTLVRYAYKNGDLTATGEPEKLVDRYSLGRRTLNPRHCLLERRQEPVPGGGVGF